MKANELRTLQSTNNLEANLLGNTKTLINENTLETDSKRCQKLTRWYHKCLEIPAYVEEWMRMDKHNIADNSWEPVYNKQNAMNLLYKQRWVQVMTYALTKDYKRNTV